MTAEVEKLRLDRFVSNQLGISRSEVKKMIYWGNVSLNGKIIHLCDIKVNPETASVSFKGNNIEYKKYIYQITQEDPHF